MLSTPRAPSSRLSKRLPIRRTPSAIRSTRSSRKRSARIGGSKLMTAKRSPSSVSRQLSILPVKGVAPRVTSKSRPVNSVTSSRPANGPSVTMPVMVTRVAETSMSGDLGFGKREVAADDAGRTKNLNLVTARFPSAVPGGPGRCRARYARPPPVSMPRRAGQRPPGRPRSKASGGIAARPPRCRRRMAAPRLRRRRRSGRRRAPLRVCPRPPPRLAEQQLHPLAPELGSGAGQGREAADQPVDLDRGAGPVHPRVRLVDLGGVARARRRAAVRARGRRAAPAPGR